MFFDPTHTRTRTCNSIQNRTPQFRTIAPKTAPAPKGMVDTASLEQIHMKAETSFTSW